MPRYKHGKVKEPMGLAMFKQAMQSAEWLPRNQRAFLVLLYWTGARVSELLGLKRHHFNIENGNLVINIIPLKGGERPPLQVPVDLPFMRIVLEELKSELRYGRLFPFTRQTAWAIVKAVFPKLYPHYFRLNRATTFLEDSTTTVPEMQTWFGWRSVRTIDSYIGLSKRYIERQAARLRKEASKKLSLITENLTILPFCQFTIFRVLHDFYGVKIDLNVPFATMRFLNE